MKTKSFWKKIKSTLAYGSKYFSIHIDECLLPDGRTMPRYYVVDFPDWVQVVAFDNNQNLILVDQYRYPGEGWFIEFPGGSTLPDRSEDPLLAAKRELLEETGYTSRDWAYLGSHYPNPALMRNRCHVYLATNCLKTSDLQLDAFEVLEVKLMTVTELQMQLKASQKVHSLMLATLELYKNHVR